MSFAAARAQYCKGIMSIYALATSGILTKGCFSGSVEFYSKQIKKDMCVYTYYIHVCTSLCIYALLIWRLQPFGFCFVSKPEESPSASHICMVRFCCWKACARAPGGGQEGCYAWFLEVVGNDCGL